MVLTALTLVIFSVYRTWRMPPIPTHDRSDFYDEVLSLSDLVGGQEGAVFRKKFTRCIIRGPGQVRYQANVAAIFCSVESANQWLTLPAGSNISGSVMFVKCDFDRCHFENVTLLALTNDPTDFRGQFDALSTGNWKAKRWSD
jgi:hypothetical protein